MTAKIPRALGRDVASLVLGARAWTVLTHRADSLHVRIAPLAVARIVAARRRASGLVA